MYYDYSYTNQILIYMLRSKFSCHEPITKINYAACYVVPLSGDFLIKFQIDQINNNLNTTYFVCHKRIPDIRQKFSQTNLGV